MVYTYADYSREIISRLNEALEALDAAESWIDCAITTAPSRHCDGCYLDMEVMKLEHVLKVTRIAAARVIEGLVDAR